MPANPVRSESTLDTLRRWRAFANRTQVTWSGRKRSWAEHIKDPGYVDEERLVQPVVFPAFARDLLGYDPSADLAAEETNTEGTPDFTPADSVTHPFVFETKGTSKGVEIVGYDRQVHRYLMEGRPRIRKVVLTNLVGVRVFDLGGDDELRESFRVNLRGLLVGPESVVVTTAEAERLVRFIREFSHQSLNRDQKLEQVRAAPEWNPLSEITSSDWVLRRLDRVVRTLTADAEAWVANGALTDQHVTTAADRRALLDEMRLIATRLGVEHPETLSLSAFLGAGSSSLLGKALRQYCSHVAYYAATRLTLVRVWEDLGLLKPMLHDGGFDEHMSYFEGIVSDVVDFSFRRARARYRSLFELQNGYTWYQPSEDVYVDVIYELANTYLGKIRSDVLGQVYERMLERIDRKLLGQYYTPRDIIALIWDMIDIQKVAEQAENEGRQPRMLDIATGSGGFLVEAAGRLRDRVTTARAAGAEISLQEWLDQVTDGLNGVEIQRFSAYLAELNLLVQLGQVVATDSSLSISSLGILSTDTLALCEPTTLLEEWRDLDLPNELLINNEDRRERAMRIKAAASSNFLMDVACGNPPYIGERLAAPLLRRARASYPYWEQFVGQHMDYLYWFLILGVSKLRQGGRFGFITTEYWLRAAGAAPLRAYLADRCHIERIVLFREFRLFADAKGQHSMIIIGTRIASHDLSRTSVSVGQRKPRISIYRGGSVPMEQRINVLSAIRNGTRAAGVHSFTATVSPNALAASPWADVILTADEIARRRRLTEMAQIPLLLSKGVETTVNTITATSEILLSQRDLAAAGGPGTRAGIQLLTKNEVDQLGSLSELERSVVRHVVNTRDVYPYAVVLPQDPTSVLYLAKPDVIDDTLSDEQVITGIAFPDGLPKIVAHLTRFRRLLEHKTRERGERRPWWTLHRPRANVVGDATPDDTGWSRYCLTTRWGGGGRLVVGIAPPHTSPASGLHILRSGRPDIPAAYLCAVYNSTLYQEIAESLPPGQLRQQDLDSIGLPDLGHQAVNVVHYALELAQIVTELATVHAPHWPLLADVLRGDISLPDLPNDSWIASVGPATSWGPILRLNWVSRIGRQRAGTTKLGAVTVDHDLYGLRVTAAVRGHDHPAVSFSVAGEDIKVAQALAARIRGIAAVGGSVADVDQLRLPIEARSLTTLYAQHCSSLEALAKRYRVKRAAIDETLDCVLADDTA